MGFMGWFTLLAGCVLLYAAYREVRQRMATQKQTPRGFTQGRATAPRLVETLTDPREAASILLVQMALYRGQVTLAQKTQIMAMMQDTFGSDEDEAEGLFSFGRMAVGQLGDVSASLKRLLRPLAERCTLAEMKDLVGMMHAVAAADDQSPTVEQCKLVDAVRAELKLPVDGDALP